MKKILLIIAGIGFGGIVYGQTRNDLQGPAYKNFKTWERTDYQVVVSQSDKDQLKGPEAKNYKSWKRDTTVRKTAIITPGIRKKLKGPKAKNYKTWKHRKDK